MQFREVDVAIIGAGTAGLNARREAERAGKSWVLIEGGPYGTTCARVGCMPSKLLIAAADAAHEANHAARFGVNVEHIHVDRRAVMTRVRSERDRFAGFVVKDTEALPEELRLKGWARFISADTLQVDDHTQVKAKAIVIATGSEPFIPPPFRAVRDALLDNEQFFDLEELPESIAVVGAGVIGLELGQALHRLGTRVTVFDIATHPGALTDPKLQAQATEIFGQELDLALGYKLHEVKHGEQGGIELRWEDAQGQQKSAHFQTALIAAGRPPKLRGLGLEHTGAKLDERGMPKVNHYTMQIESQGDDLPIFIAGDANGELPLLHEASDEGRIAGYNAAHYPEISAGMRRAPLAVAFTSPQMASAGIPFKDLNEDEIVIGEVSYNNQGRARVMGQNQGMMRVYARRRDCVLVGAEMIGPRMEHMAHLLSWAIQQNMTVPQLLQMPFYHPVLEEGMRTALRDAASALKLVGHCPPQAFAFSPGM